MSKSAVNDIINDVKILGDYNIVDTDLDALILKGINFILKRMKQWFMDEGLFDEIGAHDSFSTTASQEYVDIATETIDLDQPIILTERTNDTPVEIISFQRYRELYPDPSANSSTTAQHAAFFANRLYLGPRPSSAITYYLDYIKLITKLVAGNTLPYEDKYDELVIAGAMEYLISFLDKKDINAIQLAQQRVLDLKHDLIVAAAKNIGMNKQAQSRREEEPFFAPRKVI